MNAGWAVACLLAAVLAAGCSMKKTVMSDGERGASPPSGSSTATVRGPQEVREPSGKESAIVEVPTRVPSGSPSVAPKKGIEAAVNVAASPEGPQYKLGPEDQIRVSVWENRELTLDLVVRPDGKISMPLIQDVDAGGLTTVELAAQIRQKLLAFIKEPQVSVIVLQVNAPKYFLIGNVTRPGTYPLRSETSVLQALSLAGGFTQFASPRNIKLIRNAGGKQEVRKINYNDMIGEAGQGNYLLKSGDTIVVP